MNSAVARALAALMIAVPLLASAVPGCAREEQAVAPEPVRDTLFTPLWPIFSDDGSKVYFFGRLFGVQGMGFYEVDTAGGQARLIAWDSLDKADPKLSPDGRKILYQAADQHRLLCCARLWVMNVDGTGATDYTPWGGFWQYHHWSPDGSSVLASGPVEEGGTVFDQILRIDADGTDPLLLTRGDSSSGLPRYDVDGANIFYVTKHPTNSLSAVVYVMDGDGSNKRPVDASGQGGSYPAPSPARRELALLWPLYNVTRSGAHVVRYDSAALPAPEEAFRKISGEFSLHSAWAPDGGRIAQPREGPAGTPTNDIYLLPRDGTGATRLTRFYRVSAMSWSRDSRRIVFSSFADERTHNGIFIADTEQQTVQQLTIHR